MITPDLCSVLTPTLLACNLSDPTGLVGILGSNPNGSVGDRITPIAYVRPGTDSSQDVVRRTHHARRSVDLGRGLFL
jgi:hypothetical protein